MMCLRYLGVGASVAALTVLGVACGDDMVGGTGLSSAPPTASQSAGELSDGGSGGTLGTSIGSTGAGPGTTETPTTSVGSGDASTGDPGTTNQATSSGGPGTTTSAGDTSGGESSTSGNNVGCGNGTIEGNEQCDGANINGFSCEALGYLGGTLQCDAVTCTFDTQLCTADDSGGGTSG